MSSTLLWTKTPHALRFAGFNQCRRIAQTTYSLQQVRDGEPQGSSQSETASLDSNQSETAPPSPLVQSPVRRLTTRGKNYLYRQEAVPQLSPALRLEGKVVVITIGATNHGYSIAKAFSEAGANAIAILGSSKAKASLDRLHSKGVPARLYPVEARSKTTLLKAMIEIDNDLGSLDILINSDPVLNTYLKATHIPGSCQTFSKNGNDNFVALQAFAQCRVLRPRKHEASIISIASVGGNFNKPHATYEVPVPVRLADLYHSLAAEWAQHRIRVNGINMRSTIKKWKTEEQLELEEKVSSILQIIKVSELEAAVMWLASPTSKLVTGREFQIDPNSPHSNSVNKPIPRF